MIPADCWHEPYMPADELDREIDAGCVFWGYEDDGELVGVMGIQDVGDVDLIRHAYVLPGSQGAGSAARCSRGSRARRSGRSSSAPGPPPTGRSTSTGATASSS